MRGSGEGEREGEGVGEVVAVQGHTELFCSSVIRLVRLTWTSVRLNWSTLNL